MSEHDAIDPAQLERQSARANSILAGLDRAILGQPTLTRLVVTAFLARGHLLLEGLPGLGKTELVKALAAAIGLDWRRVQFTPDLLPGDITGGAILEEREDGRRELVFHPGPVFTHLMLADEINRASPKTQAALLEAMQERNVTVLGETRPLPRPFAVLATQNPIELEGTYPLPEAQLDRFLFKLDVRRVGADTLEQILTERRGGAPPTLEALVDAEQLDELFAAVDGIFLPRPVAGWISRLVESSHPDAPGAPDLVRQYVRFGASPRAAIAMAEAARAHALLAGKPNAGFDDVRALAAACLGHRIVLDYRARLDGVESAAVVGALLDGTPELREDLPTELAR